MLKPKDATTTAAANDREQVGWFNADRFLAGLRRVNVFAGGFGSGKTEVAVNFALHLAEAGKEVRIADLDIVNPYFRSREARSLLRRHGVEVLAPGDELAGADLPIIQPEVKSELDSGQGFLVVDLGGDPVGARVMASLATGVAAAELTVFMVLNSRRPFTRDVAGAARLMLALEQSAQVPVTDLVVNSHLIDETTAAVIAEGIELAEAVSRATGRRVAFVAIERTMLSRFDAAACQYPVMVMDRHMLPPWLKPAARAQGPIGA